MFGEPLCSKIEIIRTGWKKRKSENVSECAFSLSTPPRPILCQSLHPPQLLCLPSVLLSGDRGSRQAGEGGVASIVCGLDWVAICE